jgi:hypothetical protein
MSEPTPRPLGGLHHGQYLPPHWQTWLRSYRPGGLRSGDFEGALRITFEDESEALFYSAFCALDQQREELAVFTEHCGYHVFGSAYLEWGGPHALPTEIVVPPVS